MKSHENKNSFTILIQKLSSRFGVCKGKKKKNLLNEGLKITQKEAYHRKIPVCLLFLEKSFLIGKVIQQKLEYLPAGFTIPVA